MGFLCGARADEPEPSWVRRHYGSTDGLPVSSAASARIDADGFLWLATHDGLARFDGQRFDVHESMRFPALSGNRMLSLHRDARQRLFAHSAHGDWVAVRSGRIERVPLGDDARQNVRHVDEASLCVTTLQALYCPDGSGAFPLRLRFPPDTEPAMALPGAADAAWMITTTGDVWLRSRGAWRVVWRAQAVSIPQSPRDAVATADGALWTDAAGRLLRVSAAGEATRWLDRDMPSDLSQLRLDDDGQLWIGAANGLFAAAADRPRRVFAEQDDTSTAASYRSWRAPDGVLWISRGGRLWQVPKPQGESALARAPVLISSGVIQNVLFGDDDVVWVMTLRDGIYRLNRARVDLLDASAGIAGGNVYSVAQDRDGRMWLGSLGGGLSVIDRNEQVRHFGRPEGLPGDNPWLVAAGADGSVYAGTYAPGLWRLAAGAERFDAVALPAELLGEQVLAIAFDSAGRLWLGTTAGAWRRDGGEWQRQWPSTPRRLRIGALALSEHGEVWFGGAEGVWRQQGASGHAVADALLSRTSVRDLYRTSDGALWISTDGRGLVRVAADDPLGERARQMGRAQGLPSNSPHAVREDAHGNVWVNSNQGIFRISRAGLLAFLADGGARLSPLVLGLSDGLTELEGNGGVQPAAAFDRRGRLWFPSQRGVVRFDPLAIPLRAHPPHAIIEGLESDGQPLHPAAAGQLPLGVRSILVRYGASDLSSGSQTRFRYRLLPQERNWTDAAGARSAAFPALQPGRYRFELLAGNSDGIWAQEPAAVDFDVPHRWHETRTFRGSALVAAGLLALALVRLRLRRLHRRAAELDRQVGLRTGELVAEKARVETALSELALTHREIEDSNQRLAEQAQRLAALDQFRTRVLADVSHELRTPVMLVSLPLRELQAHAGQLATADRSRLELSLKQLDRLGGLVEQLLDLVQVEAGQARLRLRRFDLAGLLQDIAAGYRPAAEHAGVRLLVQGPPAGVVLFADGERLTTVFGNLVDNAIKYAPDGSTITLRLAAGDECATVEVCDQGPGFDSAASQHLFQRFYRAEGPPRQGREGLGIGLALARELVELHGGRIAADSTPGAGATFRVELPLGSAHVALDDLALDPAPDAAPPPVPPAQRGDGRLLLVEDHPDLAAYLAERLGEHLPVTCVGSAEQAMQVLADAADIRLVVSDVVLPGASGLELCRQISAEAAPRQRPVILISARAADTDREAGLAAGAAAYLAKPFSFEALLHAVACAWPEAQARLIAPPADPATLDPLLAIAVHGLGDAAFAIARWAELAHLSERQLRRRVGELTGLSPQTWLREQRLLRVRHLLRSGACKTMAEAGARCGLDNPAWLYRSYRARFGEH
ncbi:ATP-binding protein [Tahibacter harae]|uniref:histidine kinase n=1 Tax=Tahibacter harae TaxID=2963937 RepID=A0ABT1QMM4_9GAMM|nr:ATP-binding protein [Tahibacter harae]MCQ4163280.1 ATP-binding protein [Tahibacter harae]